jgi:hypothetical protein
MNSKLQSFLDILGITEEPVAWAYEAEKPDTDNHPPDCDMPTLEQEEKGRADFRPAFERFSCLIKHVWVLRRKGGAAWTSADHPGCPGGTQYVGFQKGPYDFIARYVSCGLPEGMETEHYLDGPDSFKSMFQCMDPLPAPNPYLVFRKVGDFEPLKHDPEFVTFFARPESMSGLHQYAAFLTNDAEVVASPWGPGCGNMVSWPRTYQATGRTRAVLGGWDPSMRKFLKTDELYMTVPYALYLDMIERWEESFLSTATWQGQRKKIARSAKAWGEE